MWSTSRRKDLVVIAASLLLLNLLIFFDIRPPFFEFNVQRDGNFPIDDNALQLAFGDALESLEFMYASQLGKAKVAELVERRFGVQKIRQCSGKGGQIRPGRMWMPASDFHLYTAYLDQRQNGLFPGLKTVRILASSFGVNAFNRTYYCHLRLYGEDNTTWSGNIVKAHIRWIWQRAWDPRNEFYNAFLISCPMLQQQLPRRIAVFVSQNQHCITSSDLNLMEVFDTPSDALSENSTLHLGPSSIKIAVCVKGLAYLDESELTARWVAEWLELQRTLGANSVGVYVYRVPDNVRKVLAKMSENGRIDLVLLDLPGHSPNQAMTRHQFIWRNRQQKRRHELIPYNDCFYRYSSNHHFVLIVDIDEVVVPLKHGNWQGQLTNQLKGRWRAEPSSISIRNVFKLWGNKSDVESLFAHKTRSSIVQERDQYGKSFMSTRSVATVFNHFALHRLMENVSTTFFVNEDQALKLHWKRKCPKLELGDELCKKIEGKSVKDDFLTPYEKEVLHNTRNLFK